MKKSFSARPCIHIISTGPRTRAFCHEIVQAWETIESRGLQLGGGPDTPQSIIVYTDDPGTVETLYALAKKHKVKLPNR